MNVIPCVTWVKRGVAKAHPDRVRLSERQMTDLLKDPEASASDSDDSNADPGKQETLEALARKRQHEGSSDDDIDEKYNMADYDDDDDGDEDDEGPSKGSDGKQADSALSFSGLAFHGSNKDDPYMARDEMSDADEDLEINPDDNLVVMGRFHEDYSSLNVYVYNEKTEYLYCHHDSLLSGFPLCLEWMDFDPGEEAPGNLVAVGSMSPDIEIWDLDVLDTLEPAFILAGSKKGKKKQKKMKTGATDVLGHTGAVLDLSWNKHHRNVLASASADFTIALWDLTEGKAVTSIKEHTEKVQTIEWHPVEAETLLSGGFDNCVKVFDCRSPEDSHRSWDMEGEVERVIWNPHNPYYFLASSDTGHVKCFDTRMEKTVFTLSAHTKAVSGMAISSSVPGCLVTASADKMVKVWDIRDNKPKTVLSRKLNIGEIHSLGGCPDSGTLFAVGGEREMRVLNLKKQELVASYFELSTAGGSKMRQPEEEDSWEIAKSDGSVSESDADAPPQGAAKAKKKKKKKAKAELQREPKEEVIEKNEESTSADSAEKKAMTKQKKKKKNKNAKKQ